MAQHMTITLNNKPMDIADGSTVESLLHQLGLSRSPCAVELNRELVPKARHPFAPLRDGDQVEIVTLVGGG